VPNRQRQPTLHLTQDPSRTEQPETAGFAQVLLRPSVLLEPDRMVPPPSWLEHVPFAFWLIDVFRPRVFVELGTQSGNSYAAFAQAVQHLGLNSVGYAIDTWKGDPQAGFYDESVFTEWKEYHDRRYSSFSTLVRSTFDEAVEHFADRSIDLLNIDGYHTVDAVNHDFQTWLPRMSPRGVVLMHDINVREGDFGAWRAWAELRDAYPSFEFLHGHGLGLLAVGTDIPSEIVWLTGPGLVESSAIVAVRQFFSRSGGTIATRYRTAAAEREAAGRINAERALNAQDQAARETELAELKARVAADEAARDAHIAAPRSGEVYNISGGPSSNCSMLEAIAIVERLTARPMPWTYSETNRGGDRIWWVSDIRKRSSCTGVPSSRECRRYSPTTST